MLEAVFCYVTEYVLSSGTATSLRLSRLLWASLGLSGPLWASLSLWASLGLSGPLWDAVFSCLGTASGDPYIHISSFPWAPPVATQFSVVRAPPVAILVISFQFISSFLQGCNSVFCSVRVYKHVCKSLGTASGDSVSCMISSHHFFGHRMWQLSFRFTCYLHTHIHICEARTPPGSGDPLISVEFIASCLWAPPVAPQ